MSNNTGTENACVHWTGSKDHSCLKNGATKISCVLDKGYNSPKDSKLQNTTKIIDGQVNNTAITLDKADFTVPAGYYFR